MEVFEIEKKVTLKIFLFFLLQDIYQKENVVLFQSVTFLTQQQMSSHQFIHNARNSNVMNTFQRSQLSLTFFSARTLRKVSE